MTLTDTESSNPGPESPDAALQAQLQRKTRKLRRALNRAEAAEEAVSNARIEAIYDTIAVVEGISPEVAKQLRDLLHGDKLR